MAYREFRNEKTYAAPQVDGLPMTMRALQDLNHRKQASAAAKAKADKERQDRFKDIQFEKPDEVDMEQITQDHLVPFSQYSAKHMQAGGSSSDPEFVKEKTRIDGLIAKSRTDAARLKEGKEYVAQQPAWYDKGGATGVLKEKFVGNGVTYENRDTSQLLDAVDPRNNPQLFSQPTFVNDALKTMETQIEEHKSSKESGSHDGASTTAINSSLEAISGIKYNEKTKSYYIDPSRKAQVLESFFSHGGANGGQTWKAILQQQAEADLDQDVQRYVAGQAAKGIAADPAAVRQQFLLEPELNPYNQKTIAQRVMDKAEEQIVTQMKVKRTYDYKKNYDQVSTDSSANKTKSTDPVITPAWQTGQAKGTNEQNMNYGGPGVTFRTNHGQKDYIFTIKSPVTYDVNGGKKENQKEERGLKTNTYQLNPVTKSGSLGLINAKDPDEFIAKVNNMTDEQILKFEPDLKGFFRGTVSDKYNTRGDVAGESEAAQAGADMAKAFTDNLLNKGKTQAISNEFVPADEHLLGQLATAGITAEQLRTPDMDRVEAAWKARYEQALNKNKPAETAAPQGGAASRFSKYK